MSSQTTTPPVQAKSAPTASSSGESDTATKGAPSRRDLRALGSYAEQAARLEPAGAAPLGPGVQMKEADAKGGEVKAVADHSFKLPDFEIWKGKAGPIGGEIKLGGDVSVSTEKTEGSAPGAHMLGPAEEKGAPPGTKVAVGGAGNSHGIGVGVEVEKEFQDRSLLGWEITPLVKGGFKLGKNGIELGIGYSLKHKLGQGADLSFTPTFNIISWEPGEELKLAEAKVSLGATLPFFHYTTKRGVSTTVGIKPALSGSVFLSAKEAAKMVTEYMASTTASTAAAAAAPIIGMLAATAGLLYAWGKAGHELDEFELEAAKAAYYGHVYTNALLGRKPDEGTGGLQVSKSVAQGFSLAKAATLPGAIVDAQNKLNELAGQRGLPPAAMRRLLPAGNTIYDSAWSAKWPSIKAAWLVRVKGDGVLERTVEAFGTGPYSRFAH